MDIENATYDPSVAVTLVGRGGLFKGEELILRLGQAVVVGRSRMCDLSVARTAECQRLGKDAMENHRSYRKISRKHLRISVLSPELIEVEDLSTNGTLVNGFRADRVQIGEFRTKQKTITIEFGDGEIMTLTPGAKPGGTSTEFRTDGKRLPAFDRLEEPIDRFDKTPVP